MDIVTGMCLIVIGLLTGILIGLVFSEYFK